MGQGCDTEADKKTNYIVQLLKYEDCLQKEQENNQWELHV